mgnify:CR=1 FL=1
MRLFMYSIYDTCAGAYNRPFCDQADGAAIRAFGDIAQDADHPFGKHPEHYQLFRLGTFDDQSATIELETPVCIAKAHELVAKVQRTIVNDLNSQELDHAT